MSSKLFDTPRESLLEIAAIVIVISFVKYCYDFYQRTRRYYELGRKLPGPKPVPILGNAGHFLGDVSDVQGILRKLAPGNSLTAIWLGPKLAVYLKSPEEVRAYFTHPDLADHSTHYDLLTPAIGKSLITMNGLEWKRTRKLLAPSFQSLAVKNLVPLFKKHSDVLVNILKTQVGKPAFDVSYYIKTCTFDIIMAFALEIDVNAQVNDVEELRLVEKLTALLNTRWYKVWQHWDYIYKHTNDGKEFFKTVKAVWDFVEKQISIKVKEYQSREKEANNNATKQNVLLRHLLDSGHYTSEEMRSHIMTILAAGHDTTTRVVSFTLLMLGLHPDVQEKAYREVREVYDNLENGQLEFEDVGKMEYLEMIVKETLRLYPVATALFRTASKDVQIGPYVIPKGADVFINEYDLHRNPDLFPDPEKFDPDRFLPENVATRHPYAYVPFASGLRTCVGNQFAMRSMKTIVSSILLHFKVEREGKMEDIKIVQDVLLKSRDGYKIRLYERTAEVENF